MEYQVSARKYRPAAFDDVVGQSHVVQTLANAIGSQRIAHAFLFSGTRGVGKTTVARILAKALNCEAGPTGSPCNTCPTCVEIAQGTSVDVIEIDGASNTSVDDVREVRENVRFAPFRGRYRVYIIDEVHMLSTSAFNALLKTLEEPPAHVIFVFATTEIHKIPATILSRCQHYNFRRITRGEIVQRLRYVAEQEGLTIEDRSLGAVARASEGSMRDALSLLDQAVAFGGKEVQHADLEALLGAVPHELVQGMVSAIVAQDSPAAIGIIAAVLDQGHDLRAYCGDVVEYVRNLLVAAVVPSASELAKLVEASEDELRHLLVTAKAFSPEQLHELFGIFSQAEDGMRISAHPRFVLEAAAVRATRLSGPGRSAEARSTLDVEAGVSAQSPHHRGERGVAAPPNREDRRPGPAGADASGPRPRPERPPEADPRNRVAEAASAPQPPADVTEASRPADPSERSASAEREWEQVHSQVEAHYPSIAPFLDRGVLIGIEGGLVTLGYAKGDTIARAMVERQENLNVLAKLWEDAAGHPVRIRVLELEEGASVGARRSERRALRQQDDERALLERSRSHPLVKQALAMFGADLVEIRQASPAKEVGE